MRQELLAVFSLACRILGSFDKESNVDFLLIYDIIIEGGEVRGGLMLKQPWELPSAQYALHQDVQKRLGEIAAASLACVLLDSVTRFTGISPGEEDFIRLLADLHKVRLPI